MTNTKTQIVNKYGNSIMDNAPHLLSKAVNTAKDSFSDIWGQTPKVEFIIELPTKKHTK